MLPNLNWKVQIRLRMGSVSYRFGYKTVLEWIQEGLNRIVSHRYGTSLVVTHSSGTSHQASQYFFLNCGGV